MRRPAPSRQHPIILDPFPALRRAGSISAVRRTGLRAGCRRSRRRLRRVVTHLLAQAWRPRFRILESTPRTACHDRNRVVGREGCSRQRSFDSFHNSCQPVERALTIPNFRMIERFARQRRPSYRSWPSCVRQPALGWLPIIRNNAGHRPGRDSRPPDHCPSRRSGPRRDRCALMVSYTVHRSHATVPA
jgi:hypothetical protein